MCRIDSDCDIGDGCRCLYKAVKPFRTFMDNVVAGTQLPVEPPEEKPQDDGDDFVPQVPVARIREDGESCLG